MIQNPVTDLTDIESQISNLRISYQVLFSQRDSISQEMQYSLDGSISPGDLICVELERENYYIHPNTMIIPTIPVTILAICPPNYNNLSDNKGRTTIYVPITINSYSVSIGTAYTNSPGMSYDAPFTYLRISKLTVESDL